MDSSLVLVRTESGNTAVEQPTRLVQRNLRTALLLVDGIRSAGEIAARFSDRSIGKSALADLQRAGMIRPVTDTQTARDAGEMNSSGASARRTAVSIPAQVTGQHDRSPEAFLEVITLDDRIGSVTSTKRAGSERSQEGVGATQRQDRSTSPANVSRTADANLAARGDMPVRLVASSSGRWGSRGRLVTVIALVSAAILLVAGIASRFSLASQRPNIERRLSQALGQPVRIGAVSLTWAPQPSIALSDVVIGDNEQLRVAVMRAMPDPRSFFSDEFVIHHAHLEGVSVSGEALPEVSRWLSRAADKPHLVVRRLGFVNAVLVLKDATVTGLRGEWHMDDHGQPRVLHFERNDGTISGDLISANRSYRLKLRGYGWRPDFLSPVVLEYFDAEGVVDSKSMQFSKVYARIADGSVFGNANVSWDNTSSYSAQLELRSLDVAKLIAQTKSDLSMKGTVSGSLKLGPTPLVNAGRSVLAEGDLSMRRCVLDRFDFAETVRTAKRHMVRGGMTRFEEGVARVRVGPQSVQISQLRIQSGLMSADGQISVGRDQSISGDVNIVLRTSAGEVQTPVMISGLLRDPVLTANRAIAKAQSKAVL